MSLKQSFLTRKSTLLGLSFLLICAGLGIFLGKSQFAASPQSLEQPAAMAVLHLDPGIPELKENSAFADFHRKVENQIDALVVTPLGFLDSGWKKDGTSWERKISYQIGQVTLKPILMTASFDGKAGDLKINTELRLARDDTTLLRDLSKDLRRPNHLKVMNDFPERFVGVKPEAIKIVDGDWTANKAPNGTWKIAIEFRVTALTKDKLVRALATYGRDGSLESMTEEENRDLSQGEKKEFLAEEHVLRLPAKRGT